MKPLYSVFPRNTDVLNVGVFSGQMTDTDTIEQLAAAMLDPDPRNKPEFVLDPQGVIHYGNSITGEANSTFVSDGDFGSVSVTAGKAMNTGQVMPAPVTHIEPSDPDTDQLIESMAQAILGREGTAHPDIFSGGEFTHFEQESPREADVEIHKLTDVINTPPEVILEPDGTARFGDTISNPALTVIVDGVFAAPANPHSDQWYVKNPKLQQYEVAAMAVRAPTARFFYLPDSGDMCWVTDLRLRDDLNKTYRVMLRYTHDHPHNKSFGGSVRVMLLNPTVDDLKQRALARGYKGVPHVLTGKNVDGKEYAYLCTRWAKDIEDGKYTVSSAVQALGWAADWLIHFEAAMVNKKVWNRWVDDEHYASWKVAV